MKYVINNALHTLPILEKALFQVKRSKWTCMAGLFLMLALPVVAQQSRVEITRDHTLAAANYRIYPTPTKPLTPAPAGYKPFYISHYGRHGSRWLIGKGAFDRPFAILAKADSLGKLTPRGREVLATVRAMRDNGRSREGELTPLGARQHQGIARRMYERFPEVFAGKAHVDAKSTVVIRCILSMENELLELAKLNPQLTFTHDASYHDMAFMNNQNSPYDKLRNTQAVKDSLKAFNEAHADYSHMLGIVFNDTAYVRQLGNTTGRLAYDLWGICTDLDNTELVHQCKPLWDIFSDDEIYNSWLTNNAYWYCASGPNRMTDGAGMRMQSDLLTHIVADADSCVRLSHPGAQLRFAHESTTLPLVCLLNINGFGNQRSGLNSLDQEGWLNYRVFPMACNVQFIFYRSAKSKDILVKILLNEEEASVPVKTDCAPYYRWKDLRAYMENIIKGSSYPANNKKH